MKNVESIDYLSIDYSSSLDELEKISASQCIKVQINEGLEEALQELESLQEQFSSQDSERLLDLCKTTVLESITSQFGLAAMFIEARDGGSVTTTHNFEKGITATEADKRKHEAFKANNDGSRPWKDVRKSGGYDDGFKQRRKKTFQTQEIIIDAYTGRPLPKDGRTHIDHIVSAKEIERNAANHLHLSPEERAKIATSDINTAFTGARPNQSKGERPMGEWLKKECKSGETNAERFGIDDKKALKKDAEARKYIRRKVTVAAANKYTKELLLTGGKDAANMAAYSAIGVILRDLIQGVFEEIHITFRQRGQESLKEIFVRFKDRIGAVLKELKTKWKDILKGSLEAGIVAFLSNIIVFIINLVSTTLKKVVTVIRAGFVSLCQAAKILANPPAGMDREEVNYQALKILTAGLIGAASLGLYAGIEKLLQAVPGLQPLMMFPIPFPGQEPRTVSDILAGTLTAVAGGLLTTVALYLMDRVRGAGKLDKLQIQLVAQSGVILHYKIAQTWCVMDDAYFFLHTKIQESAELCIQAEQELDSVNQETSEAVDAYSKSVDDFSQRLKRLKEGVAK